MLRYGHSAADNVTDRRERTSGGRGFTAHIKQLSSGTAENYVTGRHAAMPCPLYRVTQRFCFIYLSCVIGLYSSGELSLK